MPVIEQACLPDSPDCPRLSPPVAAPDVGRAPTRPPWIDDDLIAVTQRVWSKRLGRAVPEDEAVEMLVNVQRFGEALRRLAPHEGGDDERRDLGTGVVQRAEGRLLD